MKIYFYSSRRACLSVNGGYFGVTDGFPRYAELPLSDAPYALFQPESAQPLGLFLDRRLRVSAPDGFEVYHLPHAVAVYAKRFPPLDHALRICSQTRLDGALVTLFRQGNYHLSVDSPEGGFLVELPEFNTPPTVEKQNGLYILSDDKTLVAYTPTGERALSVRVNGYRIDGNTLYADVRPRSAVYSAIKCAWTVDERGVSQTERTPVIRERSCVDDLPAYAFFEEVLHGGNYAERLGEELYERRERLPAFLGVFERVYPTDDPFCAYLVRKKREGVFAVERASVSVRNGKIDDIKC